MLTLVSVKGDRLYYIDLIESKVKELLNLEVSLSRNVIHNLGMHEAFNLNKFLEDIRDKDLSNFSLVLLECYTCYDSRSNLSRKNKLFSNFVINNYKTVNIVLSGRRETHIDKRIRTLPHDSIFIED